MWDLNGRGERIRTSDPLVPNQVLYQAEPLPEHLQRAYQRVRLGTMIRWMRSHECSRIRLPWETAGGMSKRNSRFRNAHVQALLFLFRRHCPGKDAFEGNAQFLKLVRVGQRLAGHHLVALRGVVYKDGFHCGDLFQVGGL
jgi:hypothetical protein